MSDHESAALGGADPNGEDAASDTSSFYHGDEAFVVFQSAFYTDHEAFATFQFRVQALAQTLWPGTPADSIVVKKLKGGWFNRIIGISRRMTGGDVEKYILRIPRDVHATLGRDIAALMFLHSNINIPVPQLITYDESADNALNMPYMIQYRIPGRNASTVFDRLSHEQRCVLAQELGDIFRRMLHVQSSRAGYFALHPDSKEPVLTPLRPMGDASQSLAPFTSGPPYLSAFDLIKSILEAEKEWQLAVVGVGLLSDLFDRFLDMLSDLGSEGWLSGVPNSLVHLDLAPRNIMIDTQSILPQSVISAILDWNSAAFAPSFLGCAPPFWIWTWDHEDEEGDERTANDVPPTVEARELKLLFEEYAGPIYLRYAYAPQYRLLRRLTRFALNPVMLMEDIDSAEAMLREWATLRTQARED